MALTPHDDLPRVPEPGSSAGDRIAKVYGGASSTFRLLRCFGWGGLMNLGWFTWPSPFGLMNLCLSRGLLFPRSFLQRAQERLLDRSLRLLDVRPGDFVVDVACGRGRSSFAIAQRTAGIRVVGLDLDIGSIRIARHLHGCPDDVECSEPAPPRFLVADAQQLPIADASCDRVLALECAFNFPDRDRFVGECARILRPGGRLVIVDFAWRDRAARGAACTPGVDLVRGIWGWTEFSTRQEYEGLLRHHGLDAVAVHDWTSHVTRPLAAIFVAIAWLADRRPGRWFLRRFNPLLTAFGDATWSELAKAAAAHREASRLSRYLAMTAVRRR